MVIKMSKFKIKARKYLEKVRNFLKNLFFRINEDDITALSAQTTFYMILSIFPFIIFLVSLASFIDLTGEEIVLRLGEYIPNELSEIFVDIANGILDSKNQKFASISVFATLWTASYGMESLMKGISKAYDENDTRNIIKSKLLALFFTVCLAVTFILALVTLIFGKSIGLYVFGYLGYSDLFISAWQIVRYVFPFSMMACLFLGIYSLIPINRKSIKDVYIGVIFSALGWIFLSQMFSYYFNNFNNYTSTYGSIGGIIAFLIWIYWSIILILIGAEINAVINYNKCH